jgi:GDP-D-mannose 3',5'-epimerase
MESNKLEMSFDIELGMNTVIRQKKALVCGAGGFIGSHMVRRLKEKGYYVRGVDLKYPEFSKTEADDFKIMDLRDLENCRQAMILNYREPFQEPVSFDEIFQFAADMGGAGYIFTGEHDADVMHNSVQINLNICHLAIELKPGKIFYSSSACMYPHELQQNIPSDLVDHGTHSVTDFTCSLAESDAYKGPPDSEYGWEKLFSERLYMAYARNYGLNIRIARFHNIYGPEGTYKGGKEKAPAAICRKVIESQNHYIDIWGSGDQTRSFLYIDDCIDAVRLLMQSDFKEPINIGSEEMISINDLAKMVIDISGKDISIRNIPGPVGVRGRNSNNDLIRKVLNWEPKYSLYEGMVKTFDWVRSQVDKKGN